MKGQDVLELGGEVKGVGKDEGKGVEAWEREASEGVGEFGFFRVRRDHVRSPRTGERFERHVLEVPDWVNVVPVTTDGRIVLVEQYRFGSEEVTLEFPAGIIDPGEDACTAGVRELEEETGYRAASCEHLAELHANPAMQDNSVHIVVAHGCTPTGAFAQDAGEDIRVRVATVEEVERWITEGRIRHALAVVAWLVKQRNVDRG